MNKCYKLLKGSNSKINGIVYKVGMVCCTSQPLSTLFPSRWQQVAESEAKDTRWPIDVNDVRAEGTFSVVANHHSPTFSVIGKDNKPVKGMSNLKLSEAIAAFYSLVQAETPKTEDKPQGKKSVKVEVPESDDDDDDDEKDNNKKSRKSEDDPEDDPEDEDEKPKKAKKSRKSEDDDDDDDEKPESDDDEDEDEKPKKTKKGKK